ncbi:Ribonuclease H-like superfamily [Arabidopsis suecica]|uniref:Ribonuclease H-like superfamily n=1 Tax=Arabidopsis suecica TaxID=45249 RepID=A0A8T2CKF2_ARASU|nr:Ribonuclease H-like superfamily [Arabidopsis suecica]
MAAITSVQTDKPFGISQIRAYIPIMLDLDKMNYDVWREVFETHCLTFGVLDHLDGSSAPTPATEKVWKERDGLVKMWIYGTITDSLTETILKPKSSARELWLALEGLFRDNKENRALQLENDLRTITIGDLTVQEYCRKLKSLSDLLANVDSPITDRQLVMHCLNGLNEKFDGIHNVIRHRTPFPSFNTTRSMLQSEEDRLKKQTRPPSSSPAANTSSPTVLYSDQNYGNNNRGNKSRGRGGGRGNRGRGRNNNNSGPMTYGNSGPTNFGYPQWPVGPNQWPYPYYSGPMPPSPSSFPAPFMAPPSHRPSSILGPYSPRPQAHLTQEAAHDGSSNMVPTALAHAFNTMSLQPPYDPAWYMDTAATNHITAEQGTLHSVFNSSIAPSVLVGNGSLAPVTKTGHGTISSPSRSLALKNVLVCPTIIKNLVSVRRFVTDNHCSVEFDPFGFSVKDLLNKKTLLRCDSPGPLYSVTPSTPSRLPLALTTGSSLWHRRLGHPGLSVQRSLNSSSYFSNNKADLTTLCHACRLGKHTRLPFSYSTSIVTEPFQIIHSDIWTSPVLSNSGIKYYLLFMDHFTHYIWVYPLHKKSDTFSKFLHFSSYVKTQFNKTIRAFQCDNGGEYTSRDFLDHLTTTGTELRLSCPHTSQQNGRAERMLRTINNLVRTLLIQAHMPYSFWVEALFTAVHTLNLLPSSSIHNQIPFSRLFNKPADHSHLRVFGCLCYPNMLSTSSHKLAPRSTTCVFLGYPSNHRGYRCLDISTRKIIISRHVTFVEDIFPFSALPPSPKPPASPTSPPPPPIFPPSSLPSAGPIPTPENMPPPAPVQNTHPMTTRSKNGISKPRTPICLHTDIISPLPSSHVQAAKDPYWTNAMQVEHNALIKRRTWDLVPRPPATNIIRSMWLFRHKFDADGKLSRYKARLVANGKSQQLGIDCDETFSPVVKPASIRAVLHVAVARNWPLRQLDVKNAFLYGDLEETVYMHQPPGFVDKSKPDHVCLLRRSLYGLKQAPRAWNNHFANVAKKIGFTQSKCDPSLFVLGRGSNIAYLLLYVDDIVLTASTPALLDRIVSELSSAFDITDMGKLHHFLGIAVTYNDDGLLLSQQNYAADILHRASMTGCNPCATPVDTKTKLEATDSPPVDDPSLYRSLAGALQYLTFTRPDISFAVQQVCLFMHDPRVNHLNALKRILRYVKGTISYGLQIYKSSTTDLVAYSDADWAGCPSTRRSTSGYAVFLGNSLISWSSKRQHTVSRSSAEAEYRGVANAVAETSWLRNLFLELRCPLSKATIVYCDNVSATYLCSNPVKHQRTKHVEIDIHFVRERVALGQLRVLHVPSSSQYADIFTKGLPSPLFTDFRSSLNVRPPTVPTAGEC